MAGDELAWFQSQFRDLTNPRVERTRKRPPTHIASIAVCGVLSGADSFAAIHEFGGDRRAWFARFLDLTDGIPSEDTFARVLARLDPGEFEKAFLGRIQAVQRLTDARLIAIDGTTLRGSYDRRDGRTAIQRAIMVLRLWASIAFGCHPETMRKNYLKFEGTAISDGVMDRNQRED